MNTVPRCRGYFLTISTYGTRLHGDIDGTVDPEHRAYGFPLCPPDPAREYFERARMVQPAYILDQARREIVLRSCQNVCQFRRWWLFVAHIRSNHAHLVLQAGDEPERVLNYLKSYASRALTNANLEQKERRRWARHGSTRYLWTDEQLRAAIRYVLMEQGEPMSLYSAPDLWKITNAESTETRA